MDCEEVTKLFDNFSFFFFSFKDGNDESLEWRNRGTVSRGDAD